MKYPDDSVIHWLRLWKKPAWMLPEDYLRFRATVLACLHTGLLCSMLLTPSTYDLVEAVFLGKYAEKHDKVETDLIALKNRKGVLKEHRYKKRSNETLSSS
jgi:hypothetical protein